MMPSIRQDAWSPEDDVRLAEIVLRHVGTGSTQLAAFAEAGALLSRTAAACGFRWNSNVRKKYEEEMKKAKEKRKEMRMKKKKSKKREPDPEAAEPKADERLTEQAIDYAIQILKQVKERARDGSPEGGEMRLLQEEKASIESAYRKMERQFQRVKSNYERLLHVLNMVDQARQNIPAVEDDGRRQPADIGERLS